VIGDARCSEPAGALEVGGEIETGAAEMGDVGQRQEEQTTGGGENEEA
jgi:hypothetical protein